MWQLREHHPEHLVRTLGCRDCLVEGEAEKVAGGPLFADAVSGRESCRQVLLEPRSTQVRGEMSVIRGEQQWPARESRSRVAACGRGCQFFSPDLLAFRSIPKDRISCRRSGCWSETASGASASPLRRYAVLRARRLESFDVNDSADWSWY
jgi:hypothetical protein